MITAESMRRALTCAVLCGLGGAALAQVPPLYPQTRTSALHISRATLRSVMQCVPSSSGKPGAFSAHLVSDSTYSVSLIRLTKPDLPHAHGAWSEIYLVEQGSGVMQTGGTITGKLSHNSATHGSMFLSASCWRRVLPGWAPGPARAPMRPVPGDKAGTAIAGGTKERVERGDMVLIPAGVPHRWLRTDGPVTYLDIKFPKAQ